MTRDERINRRQVCGITGMKRFLRRIDDWERTEAMSDDRRESEGTIDISWAVLEIFGHHSVAGRISPVKTSDDAPEFIQVVIPTEPEITQLYAQSAIFSLTPVTEEQARTFVRDSFYALPLFVQRLAVNPNLWGLNHGSAAASESSKDDVPF